ncbi:hypothetical protein BOTBODRAFT_592224 [Botryobasidium botryosum FD-172 SS1]|uniref:Protein kinase domain-containing protein n=1 Tax=Botryobasidium botryosum (strain FD-172 SS1) TaxID=930990 RepID=A0A067LWU7_BOTB1|nr:hypothetical protein BOTBODRAFT_592224 [Botryobasidium botryosum FD-172 SS1]
MNVFHYAAKARGHLEDSMEHDIKERFQPLLRRNADLNATDDKGGTPLHIAVQVASKDAVAILIREGADTRARDREGNTPLHGLQDGENFLRLLGYKEDARLDIIRAILTTLINAETSAEIDARNYSGQTPLYCAIEPSQKAIATTRELLRLGADIHVHANNGESLHGIMQKSSNSELFCALRDNGIEIHAAEPAIEVAPVINDIIADYENSDSRPWPEYSKAELIRLMSSFRKSIQGGAPRTLSADWEHPGPNSFELGTLSDIYEETKVVPPNMQICDAEITLQSSEGVASGGFASLYKGVLWGKLPIAMKRLVRTEDKQAPGTQERMEKLVRREVRIWCRLQHPHVLPLIGTHKVESTIYMVSPWMENGSAEDYIRCNPSADRVKLLLQAAQGLEYLHTLRPAIVHGDIYASNILISASGDACIADFGLSFFMQEDQDYHPASVKYGGNERWQAPELWGQAPKNKKTRESDTFAFGRTMYQVLTGEVPFASWTRQRVVVEGRAGNLLPPRPASDSEAVQHGLNDDIWKLLAKCQRKAPGKRPSMATVVSELEAIYTWVLFKWRRNLSNVWFYCDRQPSKPR